VTGLARSGEGLPAASQALNSASAVAYLRRLHISLSFVRDVFAKDVARKQHLRLGRGG
jgi:hypothetical protein